jgi:hypothetical protein
MNEQGKTKQVLAIAKIGVLAVHAAGKQLAIAAQLQKDVERRRFVALLKRIGAKEAAGILSCHCRAVDGDLLRRFANHWEWAAVSRSKSLSWSLALFGRFVERWDWKELSANESLPWSSELIKRFERRWD